MTICSVCRILAIFASNAISEGKGGRSITEWAYEFLVEEMGLDKDRLYATVFEGSKEDGLNLDTEAKDFWKKYLPEERILNGSKKDNFWEMGDTGPCGP